MSAVLERMAQDERGAQLLAEVGGKALAVYIKNELRRIQPPLIHAMARDLAAAWSQLGQRVAATYERVGRPVDEAAPTSAALANLVDHILSSSSLRDWAGGRLTPSFLHWYGQNMAATARVLQNAGLASNVRGSAQSALLAAGGRRLGLLDIVGDTKLALFRALEQAQADGLGPRLTARLIRSIVPEGRFVNAGANYRAQLIARTEMLHAQRASSLAHYRANRFGHVVAFDGDSDEECAARNGAIFTLGDAEIEMDNTHPNCVLCFSPVAS